ncbi:MAG TPA: zf-HC2 domain-containing protein [Steroidobacteraceae bacterium]|nr:zf-HC2 domain-containing protein [Steroidobacteraceae bacterium]
MQCPETLRLQAYFDGEVDALAAADIERHVQSCRECRQQLADFAQARGLLRGEGAAESIPGELRERIMAALDREPGAADPNRSRRAPAGRRSRPFWAGVVSGVGGSAVAAALAYLILTPLLANPLLRDLVADHTRSLMSAHLVDVVSTDQHTVKPWFAGRTDLSPVVADFAPQGYRLLGGRVDDLLRQRAAVLVYQHGAHYISVFGWVVGARGVPGNATRNGYHLACWKVGNVGYCAVSDTAWSELQGLVRLLQEQGARERE